MCVHFKEHCVSSRLECQRFRTNLAFPSSRNGMATAIKSPKSKRGGKAEREFAAALALPSEALRLVQKARHRGSAIDSWVIHCQLLQRTVRRTHEVPRERITLGRLRTDTCSMRAAARRAAVSATPPLRKTPTPLLTHTHRGVFLLIDIIGQVLRKPAVFGLILLDASARRHAAVLKLPHDLDLTAAANARASALIRSAAAETRAAAERAATTGGSKGVKKGKAPPMPSEQVRDRRTDGRTDRCVQDTFLSHEKLRNLRIIR